MDKKIAPAVVFSSSLLFFTYVVEISSLSIDVFLLSSIMSLEVQYTLEFPNEATSLAIPAPEVTREGLRRGGGVILSSSTSCIRVSTSTSLSVG